MSMFTIAIFLMVAGVAAGGLRMHARLRRLGYRRASTMVDFAVPVLIMAVSLVPFMVWQFTDTVYQWPYIAAILAVLVLTGYWYLWRDRDLITAALSARSVPGRPTVLVIYRGLPGCGKSTHAKKWVDEEREHRSRINRDLMRVMMHGGYFGRPTEEQVTTACLAMIGALLRSGTSVADDNTNLRDAYVQALIRVAAAAGAAVQIVDMRTVPLQVCLERNAQRAGAERLEDWEIRKKWEDHIQPHLAKIASLN